MLIRNSLLCISQIASHAKLLVVLVCVIKKYHKLLIVLYTVITGYIDWPVLYSYFYLKNKTGMWPFHIPLSSPSLKYTTTTKSRIDIDIADLYLIYVMLTQSLNQGNNNLIKYDTVCWRYTINNIKIHTVSN